MQRLDIEDRRSVDALQRVDANAISGDLKHFDLVNADRVRPIRRTRGKHAGERSVRDALGMNLKCLAIRLVQPRKQDQFNAHADPEQRRLVSRVEFEPRFRRVLVALARSRFAVPERRTNYADRMKN